MNEKCIKLKTKPYHEILEAAFLHMEVFHHSKENTDHVKFSQCALGYQPHPLSPPLNLETVQAPFLGHPPIN